MIRKSTTKASAIILFLTPALLFLGSCSNPESETEIVEEGYKSINGTEIFYKRTGSGEPVMIVHGGPVLEHGYLEPDFRPLTEKYELIYFDQRLSGRSSADVDSADIRLDIFVEDIEELRKALDVEKMHLMAHSWGGLLALKYAVKYSSNLNSLILLNSMPASSELWQEESRQVASRTSKQDSLRRREILSSDLFETEPSKAVEQLLILSFRNQFADPSLADSLNFYIPANYMTRSRLFGNLMVDLVDYDIRADLDPVTVPALLIYGDKEPAATLSGPDLRSVLSNSRLIIIQNSGHFPFIEQPDTLFSVLQSFLESV